MLFKQLLLFFIVCLPVYASTAEPVVHHTLDVKIIPDQHQLIVRDTIHLPDNLAHNAVLLLNANFKVNSNLKALATSHGIQQLQIPANMAGKTIHLEYQGQLPDSPDSSFSMPNYVINQESVYLDENTLWYPTLTHTRQTFDMTVEVPESWLAISQGKRSLQNGLVKWSENQPQQGIYLLADQFSYYQQKQKNLTVEVYLLKPDAKLAQQYIDTSFHYIEQYSNMLGAYPYAKFAIIENHWQTGFGMPSFTLLGSQVMRLPFILHSSLPHEILHNWWGNGVYVDNSMGNWSEGLTAYLADHWIQQSKGQGAAYRRQALEKFSQFAANGRDIPLKEFKYRHSDSSQAVGYSKSLMLFHQIRYRLGEQVFLQTLKHFAQKYQFKAASFTDLFNFIEKDSGISIADNATIMLTETGAPAIQLEQLTLTDSSPYQLKFTLSKKHSNSELLVPVVIEFAKTANKVRKNIRLTQPKTTVHPSFKSRPSHITIDPDYDVFRLLDNSEQPSSLGKLFGAESSIAILPYSHPDTREAWLSLVKKWQQRYPGLSYQWDNEITALPEKQAIWVMGSNNAFAKKIGINSTRQSYDKQHISIDNKQYPTDQYVAVLLDENNQHSALAFVSADDAQNIALLARKLPHYASYGRLLFQLPGVKNQIKQKLPVLRSALSVDI